MRVAPQSNAVRKNIELFQKAARRLNENQTTTLGKTTIKHFPVLIHKVSGEIAFTGQRKNKKFSNGEWQTVEMELNVEGAAKEGFRIAQTATHRDEPLELTPAAFHVMQETVQLLNQVYQQLKTKKITRVLEEIIRLQLEPIFSLHEAQLIESCWRLVSREKAEKLLLHQEKGSYFFRQDIYAKWLEESLSEAHRKVMKCLTLSYKGKNDQVMDKTIICLQNYWMIYDGDPQLRGKRFIGLKRLLKSLSLNEDFSLLSSPESTLPL